MANISVTYSFTNGTAADSTQVNTNFTDIINGTSDGTKDFAINALSCAGAVTLNNNTTIGNASSDDLTITASLASSIPIKTTRSYDIGSADLGLRILYLGMNSTHTIALCGPSSGASADYTLTLPAVTAGTGDVLYSTNTSSTLGWKKDTVITIDNAAGTAGETLTNTDESSRIYTNSAAITVKFDNTFTAGRIFYIYNNGTAIITLTANDDATIRLVYPKTCGIILCNTTTPTTNTSWTGLNKVTSDWIDGSSTFTLTAAFGTTSNRKLMWRREGKNLEGQFVWQNGTVAGSVAAFDLISGLTIDYTNVYSSGLQVTSVGICYNQSTGADVDVFPGTRAFPLFIDDADTDRIWVARFVNNNRFETTTGSAAFNSSAYVSLTFRVAISGWEEFSK